MKTSSPRLAIVSTVKEFTQDHELYIKHHHAMGIEFYYFFLDDASKANTIPIVEKACKSVGAHLSIRANDQKLKNEWEAIPGHEALWKDLSVLVVNRQALNVYLAEQQAIKDGIDWLIHIDDDELLWPSGWNDLRSYFSGIPETVSNVTFLNLEALYEKDDYTSKFDGILNFKKNPHTLAPAQISFFNEKLKKKYLYISYAHGKSALRISSLKNTPKIPSGVHHFESKENRIYFEANHLDLVLLHFPFTGISGYLDKFTGVNSKRVYQYELAGTGKDNFYIESREIFSKQDSTAVADFYRKNVVYTPEELQQMKKAKLIFTITK